MEKARILVVDDTPANLEILSELLTPVYRVNIALNGFDAIEIASSPPMPDLILLDIMMPGMDGYQVCSILKEKAETRRIPLIFVTAMAQAQSEEKGLALGAVDYITKPFNPSIVLARVRTHLALYNQTRLLQDLVKKRTAELEKARTEAVLANKAKSAFLANMNHELRTPLNGIMGMTQLLMTTNPSEEQKEFLEYARVSSARLLTMVNDLLDLSNAEAGKIQLAPTTFNVRESLDGLIAHYQKRATEKGLHFQHIIEDNVPKLLHADIARIRQVLINLLNNAVQFTEQGAVSLSVASPGNDGDTVKLAFRVTDTGVGIAEEQQKNIFEPFTIGEHYMTKRYGGAGLGLAISKLLVSLMGGHIWLASSQKNNTSFSFIIPCKKQI